MKRTILSMLLLGSTCALFAQTTGTTQSAPPDRRAMDTMFSATGDDQEDQATTNTSTGTYSAYGTYTSVNSAPTYIQHSFTQSYPTAANVTWHQATDWYRASYMVNGRNMNVYYGPNGSSYAVALPVIQSYVPEEVISKAMSMHGQNLYSITGVRTAEGQDAYQVTLLENGQTRSQWIGADGSTIANAYRTDDANAANGTMNNGQMNNGQLNNGQMNNGQMNNGQLNSNQMNSNNQSLNNGTGTNQSTSTSTGTTLDNGSTTTGTTNTTGTTGTTGTTTGTTGTTTGTATGTTTTGSGTTSGSATNSTNNTSTDKSKTKKPGQ